jgi:hypothetical protein
MSTSLSGRTSPTPTCWSRSPLPEGREMTAADMRRQNRAGLMKWEERGWTQTLP